MKKTLVFALVIAMVFAAPVTAFADAFHESPSNNPAAELVGYTVTNGDWDGEIIVTPYSHRNELPPKELEEEQEAYDSIKGADSAAALESHIAQIAEKKKVDAKELFVSDLFDVRATKPGMGSATITLKSERFGNFIALLHFTNGKWEVVDNAKCTSDLELTFTVDDLSPFAVVVSNKNSPPTGESNDWAATGLLALALLSGAVGVAFLAKSKRETV